MMSDDGLAAFLIDSLKPLGSVSIRKMFGGAGVYINGAIIGITADGELYLKANADTRARFEAAGCEPFTYEKGDGKTASMSYYRAPSDVYDDTDELIRWVRVALLAATAPKPKKPKAVRK
jgi:DNA transformation protein and related proteins